MATSRKLPWLFLRNDNGKACARTERTKGRPIRNIPLFTREPKEALLQHSPKGRLPRDATTARPQPASFAPCPMRTRLPGVLMGYAEGTYPRLTCSAPQSKERLVSRQQNHNDGS